MTMNRNHLLSSVSICVGLLVAVPASAASLQSLEQSEWWGNVAGLPSYVNMFLYAPDQLAASPPIVVAPHHCQGTGPGTYSEMSSLVSLADQNGFIMIFPEATGQNCWDAGSARSLTHDGNGDTHAIVQMVRYTLSTYGANAARVYSVGGSSGGIMTEALLGVYPDIFMAGVSLMGVPCGCWAEGYNDVQGTPSDGTGQWSGPCSGGNVTKTAEQWGDLVRSYFPAYAGHRPRLQHWHGTADTVLSYDNVAEDIKEWTNVLGLNATPTGSDTPASGTTRKYWDASCGFTVYETFDLAGVGHSVPFDGSAVAAYFGLEDADGVDPEVAACPGEFPSGGAGGAAGLGGAAGMAGAGGTAGSGGNSEPAGGTGALGGFAGAQLMGGTGGASGGAGVGGGAVVVQTGGSSQMGGAAGSGGVFSTGGSDWVATGGVSPAGGTSPAGGVGTTGGGPSSGGSSATGGSGVSGGSLGVAAASFGGATAAGGVSGLGGDPSSSGVSEQRAAGSDGCGCALAGQAGGGHGGKQLALLVATLAMVLKRRRGSFRRLKGQS